MEVPREKLRLRDDPKLLSPPIVTQPLYACAKVVNVTGYVPNATIDLEVNGVTVTSGFGGGSPAPWGVTIPLANPLAAGQKLRARQGHSGAKSAWSQAAVVK